MDRRRALVSRSPPGMPDPANPGSASWRWLQTVGSWRKIGARLASLTVRPAGQPGLERRAERSLPGARRLHSRGKAACQNPGVGGDDSAFDLTGFDRYVVERGIA
jgi:hypothetical protein